MKDFSNGQGFLLKNLKSINESSHYENWSCVYLLDPNPNTFWDSNSQTPRFVEFTFTKSIKILAYSIKMSLKEWYIRSWEVKGTLNNEEFTIDNQPHTEIFNSPHQYEVFQLNKPFKVDKVKLIINEVTDHNASYISNIDFLVDEGTFLQCNSLNFDKFRILIAIFIYYMN